MNNSKLENLISEWVETGNYKLISKIVKLSSPNYVYKLCKKKYRETHNRFYIRSMRKINLLYCFKAILFQKKEKQKELRNAVIINSKVDKLNKIISEHVDNDNFIYIMQYSFFDKIGENYFSGGGERYACDLGKIIIKKGYKPILLQCGDENAQEHWVRQFDDLTVIGVNSSSEDYFKILNRVKSPKLTIYSGFINWDNNEVHTPSIIISHGITWDHPKFNANPSFLQNILTLADYIVSVDTNTISWFRSTFSKFIADNNIQMKYVPNYVDLDTYKPLNKENERIRITYPRRCSDERGFWLIANIIPKLLNNFKNVEFDLVGFAHTEEIQNKIDELLKLFPDRLRHYVCAADEMVNIYQKTDISVIPTIYSEGTSLSCIEAMACGNAVIATDIGGLPNLVINNYNGLLIGPYEEDIYQALETLILDNELRNSIKINAKNVAQVFSKKAWNNSWNEIFDNILGAQTTSLQKEEKRLFVEQNLKKKFTSNIVQNLDISKKNRLFITTGFVATINAMSIIRNLNNLDYDNYLIIYSSKTDDLFKDYNLKLILDGYFKIIFFADDISKDENIKFIEDETFLAVFNEIYTTAQSSYNIWNKHTNINLIEEGISSYFPLENIDYNNISKIYLSKYFDKINYFDKQNEYKVSLLDKISTCEIIKQIRIKNGIDFKYLKKDNQILLLSQYIFQDFLSNDEVIALYTKHIDNLILQGYNVLFKSHPRVNDTITMQLSQIYKNNKSFDFFPIDIKYPVELIISDLELKAIVTSMSGGAINCAHLFNIPCFGFGANLVKSNHPFENIKKYSDVFIEVLPHISNFTLIKSEKAVL